MVHRRKSFTPINVGEVKISHCSRKQKILAKCNRKRVFTVLLFLGTFILTVGLMITYFYVETDLVCFSRVGCFNNSGPWSERPAIFNFFPQSPKVINTTFIVTTRQHETEWDGIVGNVIIPHKSIGNLSDITWGQSELVFFIVHGYTDDSSNWMQTLTQSILGLGDVTVILVDWKAGASGHYPQVVANTRVVAREISLLIDQFHRHHMPSSKRIHLIGHSLGAQISSYVGKEMQSFKPIYQITALDPAYPLFEGYPREVRLHRKDAKHVLVIHSNIGPWGLGMKEPVGTIDIYLNNGRDQRGCLRTDKVLNDPSISGLSPESISEEDMSYENKTGGVSHERISDPSPESIFGLKGIFSDAKDLLACSHRRAYEFLEDVLDTLGSNDSVRETFTAYEMSLDEDEKPVRDAASHSFCGKDEDNCWHLKFSENDAFFKLQTSSMSPSTFHIPTTHKSPFCVRFAHFEVKVNPQFPMRITSKNVTISYDALGDNVPLYKGSFFELDGIKSWIELPCSSSISGESKVLNLAVKFTHLKNSDDDDEDDDDDDENKKKMPINTFNGASKTKPSGLHFHHAKLTYLDVRKEEVISEWLSPKDVHVPMFSDTCFQMTNADL